jgi:hypothetical protein
LALAAASWSASAFFERVIHTTWLAPGLVLGLLLMLFVLLTRPADKSKKKQELVRKFRAPRLEPYRGASAKRHQDLEI